MLPLPKRDIDVQKIEPMHPPLDAERVDRLTESMTAGGWGQHRPLLVEANAADYFFCAWTGMHRLEAAKRAGLKTVPCLVVARRDLDAGFAHRFPTGNVTVTWWVRELNANGYVCDDKKLEFLASTELDEVASALAAEMNADPG